MCQYQSHALKYPQRVSKVKYEVRQCMWHHHKIWAYPTQCSTRSAGTIIHLARKRSSNEMHWHVCNNLKVTHTSYFDDRKKQAEAPCVVYLACPSPPHLSPYSKKWGRGEPCNTTRKQLTESPIRLQNTTLHTYYVHVDTWSFHVYLPSLPQQFTDCMLKSKSARTEPLKGSYQVCKRATGIFYGHYLLCHSVLCFELHTGAVLDLDPCLEQCLPSNLSRVVQRHQDMPARITSSTPYPVHLHTRCDIKTCSISLTWK